MDKGALKIKYLQICSHYKKFKRVSTEINFKSKILSESINFAGINFVQKCLEISARCAVWNLTIPILQENMKY